MSFFFVIFLFNVLNNCALKQGFRIDGFHCVELEERDMRLHADAVYFLSQCSAFSRSNSDRIISFDRILP
jgi:hypothetical protein